MTPAPGDACYGGIAWKSEVRVVKRVERIHASLELHAVHQLQCLTQYVYISPT